ncbi:MAG TPA: OsmC family protein [Caulobacteraceae bacterium]|jgi:putative redox protein|nr:OsmC family protein [Caulobacteraceae bacterium]
MSETTAPTTAPSHAHGVIARAHARNAGGRWETALRAGHHALVADESPHLDGRDKGPAPFEYLLAALGACTAITLRMYAERKAWRLEAVDVDLTYREEAGAAVIDRVLTLAGPLDDAQRARFRDIAERTPVTKVLKTGAEIRTTLTQERSG